jgi:hypothetical protein
MADLPPKKPVPSNMRMSPMENESFTGLSDLPKRKPAPMQDKITKDQLVARINDKYNRKDPMEDRSDEEQNLSQKMRNMGFKKGGAVKGKSVPQSQKKNRKKG